MQKMGKGIAMQGALQQYGFDQYGPHILRFLTSTIQFKFLAAVQSLEHFMKKVVMKIQCKG